VGQLIVLFAFSDWKELAIEEHEERLQLEGK